MGSSAEALGFFVCAILVLLVLGSIYNAGYKSGKREGSRKAYGVGYARGRRSSSSGCLALLLALVLPLILVALPHRKSGKLSDRTPHAAHSANTVPRVALPPTDDTADLAEHQGKNSAHSPTESARLGK
jgi:hypothetical protein